MIGALAFLMFQSWKNRMKMRLLRLKQPKYLFGAAVGVLYLYSYFYRFLLNPRRVGVGHGLVFTPETVAWLEPLGALILFVIVLVAWVIPHERGALVFTEAEVAFLFPAPVGRRSLIRFKLLKSQIRILFSVFFLMLVSARFMAGGIAWIHALGWWIILSTLNLHFIGSSFARTMLMEQGISTWKRRALVLGLVAVAVVTVVLWAKQTIPPPDPAQIKGASDIEYYIRNALNSGPALYLLYPFRLVVRPYLQTTFGAFLVVVGPALALLALHYFWVMRSNVAFEEASIEASKKMAERIATIRANRGMGARPKKKKRAPFKLKPHGLPAVGFLWKNLIGAGQMFTFRFWLMLVWITVVGVALARSSPQGTTVVSILGFVAVLFAGMTFLIGPQLVRQDFRHDLPMADLLKTYPLPPWQLALGELFAPAVILTCTQWLLLAFAIGTFTGFAGQPPIAPALRMGIACGVAVIAPGLNFIILIIPNAAVLLFPGWFQAGREGPQGIEATGQRLIFALGQLVVLIVALLPASAVFAMIYFLSRMGGAEIYVAIPAASLGAALVLGCEASLGVLWLGRLFEKFDVAGDGATSG